jgi:LacI family transcriptional regulator
MTDKKDPTIYDLAKRLNISSSTVSRALSTNSESVSRTTRKKVLALANEMGYRKNNFASQLRIQKTHTIGVIAHELNSPFITAVLRGIEKVVNETQYNIIVGNSWESNLKEITNADNFFRKRVDGLIASLAYDTVSLSHYEPFVQRGIPIVFFDRVETESPGIKVVIDNKIAGYNAAKHLIEQGCKRIMHVTGSLSRNVYSERLLGFKDALLAHNLEFESNLLAITNLDENAGLEIARQIMDMKARPDGLFVVGDLCASVCIVVPGLTTVNYSGIQMGEVAAQKLVGQLNGTVAVSANYTIILNSNLVIRDSSLKRRTKMITAL